MKDELSLVELRQIQQFTEDIALGAGKILLKHFHTSKIVKRKSDFGDIATNADLASEKYILSQIHKKFPTHHVLSEESGDTGINSDFVWVVDPLDGTKEYSRGIPFFNVSIALEYCGDIVVGVTYRPSTNELFSAVKNGGAFLNKKRLSVSLETNLSKSFVSSSFPFYKNPDDVFNKTLALLTVLVKKAYRLRPFQETVANFCWVASGAHDGSIVTITGPKWWDIAPGILLIQEAGGNVTDTYGSLIKNHDLSRGIVASNGKIHNQLLEIIRKEQMYEQS